MPREKKLLIATIILGAMFPISAFALSFISEAFLIVGMYCGISALFCGIILIDLKSGKSPNLIPIGLGMAFFGFVFLAVLDFYPFVSIPLSALYAVAGLATFVKGIKNWHDAKQGRAPKVKKPMNKKIYIGIGLIVGGYIATFVLFNILPLLMSIGHIMIVVGIVFIGRGIAERKNGTTSAQTVNRSQINTNTTQIKYEHCARCGKNITHPTSNQVFVIDGTKYCSDCKTAIEQDAKNQHMVCSVCGVDLPVENMHVIDDALLCHDCFLKKYGNLASYDDEVAATSLDDALKTLRAKIIEEITKNPSDKYQLASLLWQEAANCFPKGGSFQWDGAWFHLDLNTGKLKVNVSTYPNQFGACYEDNFSLSASEFHRIAKQFNMDKELQAFQSDDDWQLLLNDTFKAAVSSANSTLKKKEEERKAEEIKQNAIKIPANYAGQSPKMNLTEVLIEIYQRYSDRSVKVLITSNKYSITYVMNSHMSSDIKRYSRELTSAEAVWLEKQVENTINNRDNSTWQSLPGGDTMNVIIKRDKGADISHSRTLPIRKFSDLQNELEKLAQYGSTSN